jgi:Ca2+-binding EF-hand superfamily protein
VHSQLAFNAMDRNKDGFITKGELKLAKKKMSMKDVEEARKEFFSPFLHQRESTVLRELFARERQYRGRQ